MLLINKLDFEDFCALSSLEFSIPEVIVRDLKNVSKMGKWNFKGFSLPTRWRKLFTYSHGIHFLDWQSNNFGNLKGIDEDICLCELEFHVKFHFLCEPRE